MNPLALDSELFSALVKILGANTAKALWDIFFDEAILRCEGKSLEAERCLEAIKELETNNCRLISLSKKSD